MKPPAKEPPMRADNSHHIVEASYARRQNTLARAQSGLHRLLDAGEPISVARLADEAQVSRSWIYAEPELRAQIEQAATGTATGAPAPDPSKGQHASAASLLRRLELAQQRIQQLTDDNRRLRDQLARTYGQHRAEHQTGRGRTKSASSAIGPCS
jgi:small-conductance mechanosensitive channel